MANTSKTKIFFDTEFTGLHQGTTLISIGLVSECGKTGLLMMRNVVLIEKNKDTVDNYITKRLTKA